LSGNNHAHIGVSDRGAKRLDASVSFDLPLLGFRIVERGERLAVGVCGAVLRDLGAQVFCTGLYDSSPDLSAYDGCAYLRHGKSIVPASALPGHDGDADVILYSSDFTPAPDVMNGDAGRQILCDITALGSELSRDIRPLTDLQIQAMSAIVDTTGLPDAPPTPVAFPVVEMTTGLYAAAAVVAALRVRRLSGRGQNIDMSLFDCAFVAMATFVPEPMTGVDVPIARMGNMHPSAAPWNSYRAKDGSLVICAGSSVQWQRLCSLIRRPELASSADFATQPARVANRKQVDEAIEAWTSLHSLDECSRKLSAISIANGRVAKNEGYPHEPNLAARESVFEVEDARSGHKTYISSSPIRVDAESAARIKAARPQVTGSRPVAASGSASLPLRGVRVIEIGQYTTAPLIARYCANLGADVIKVEPPGGESTRTWPPLLGGQSIFCRFNNSGKRMIALDLKSPEDAAILCDLIRKADVIVENMKPGSLAKLGFSFDTIRSLNQNIVYCAINGYGMASLYPGRPAYDTVIQAESGIMAAVNPDGEPVKTGISTSDLLGAQFGLLGILAALEYVATGGPGVNLDISMQDASAWVTQLLWDDRAGKREIKTIPCSDGYIVAEARAAAPLLDTLSLDRFRTMTRADADAELQSKGITTAPVLRVNEMLKLPVVSHRKLFDYRGDAGLQWPILACPLRLTETPPLLMQLAAPVDFHRAEILDELRALKGDRERRAVS
jgi:crotonobetainyl-CoA:carnitine CoA-transferase CaiB-like acyl-CoA transferase